MYKIYLASESTRRKEILKAMGYNFTIRKPKIDENFDPSLSLRDNITRIALKKAQTVYEKLADDRALVISGDTIVVSDGQILGKPKNESSARKMLKSLSSKTHEVITAYCVYTDEKHSSHSVVTRVHFDKLSEKEIDFYINRYKPLDKAGAYGIQEWIGMIGISSIEGDYYNVMGLPANSLYTTLAKEFGVFPY